MQDTTLPVVSLTAPAGGTSVSAGSTVIISASASDNVGVSKVEFYRGTTLLGTDTAAPYSYSWNTSGTAAGAYNMTAKAFDAAGNTATSSAVSINLTSSVPSTPITITAPSAGATLSGVVAFSANFSGSGTIGGVSFRYDQTFIESDLTAPYSIQWDTRNVPNGTHTLIARTTGGTTGVVDSVPMTVTINNPSSPTIGNGDANNDTRVNALDLSIVISKDGQNYPAADFNKDGTVGAADLSILLSRWTW